MFSWNAAGSPLSFNVGCQNLKFHFCCFRFFEGETSWNTQCTQGWSNPIGMEKSHHESMIISFGVVNIKSICTRDESNVLQHVQLSSPKSLWSSLFWTKSPFSKTHCISNCPRALRLPIPEPPKVFTSSPAWASPMLALKSPPMIGIASGLPAIREEQIQQFIYTFNISIRSPWSRKATCKNLELPVSKWQVEWFLRISGFCQKSPPVFSCGGDPSGVLRSRPPENLQTRVGGTWCCTP